MTNDTADAVVVGAGLNGAATAYFLLQAGLRRVVILDSQLPCGGASGASVGLLRTHYDNRPEMELAARSMPYFREWSDRIGGECGWLQTGFYRFVEPDQLEPMRANVAMQREFGERVEILTPDMLRDMAPEFSTEGIGAAVHEPDSGTASNSAAVRSLLAQACARGGELRPFCAAQSLVVEGERIVGVTTERGTISSPVVVLAAGAQSRRLAGTIGLDLPLHARAICVAEIAPPSSLRIPGSYMDPVSNSWISPRQQGSAIITAPHEDAGRILAPDESERGNFPREAAEAGLAPVARRLPGMERSHLVRWWRSADCYAPDGKPVIGPVAGTDGLYLNTAGAGKGHKVAPAIGLALAELITDGEAGTADIAPFAVDRFTKNPQSWSKSEYRQRVIG